MPTDQELIADARRSLQEIINLTSQTIERPWTALSQIQGIAINALNQLDGVSDTAMTTKHIPIPLIACKVV